MYSYSYSAPELLTAGLDYAFIVLISCDVTMESRRTNEKWSSQNPSSIDLVAPERLRRRVPRGRFRHPVWPTVFLWANQTIRGCAQVRLTSRVLADPITGKTCVEDDESDE